MQQQLSFRLAYRSEAPHLRAILQIYGESKINIATEKYTYQNEFESCLTLDAYYYPFLLCFSTTPRENKEREKIEDEQEQKEREGQIRQTEEEKEKEKEKQENKQKES